MSDDLSLFFAKKQQKSKDKKKKGVHVGDIGSYLDQASRHHEVTDREETDRNQRQTDNVASQANDEDSEWIERPNDDIQLAEIGIKDMDVSELTDDEEEEEQKVETEPTKTWNVEQNGALKRDKEQEAEKVAEPIMPAKPSKYVPPSSRSAARRRGVAPQLDLKSEEMFPSIANAEKIEKDEKAKLDDKKNAKSKDAGWKNVGEPAKPTPGVYRPPHQQTYREPTYISRAAPPQPVAPTPGKYVPPNKRNVQGV